MGERRGGSELFCLLGGDQLCKLTKAGKGIRLRKICGGIGAGKKSKREYFWLAFNNPFPCSLTNWQ